MTTRRLIATAAFIACFATLAHGAIFLKEDATGAGDGSSWTDAFTTWADAMTSLRAIGNNGDATLYVAKGIYPAPSAELTNDGATSITNANFAVRGGCRADFDGDLERDPETYQTFVTSGTKSGVLGAYWKRITPNEGSYDCTTENVKVDGANFKLIDSNGRLQIPDFAGAHDTFWTSYTGGSIPVYIGSDASGVLDGIRFICCARRGGGAGVVRIGMDAGDITITNCLFTTSAPQGGCIIDNAGTEKGTRLVIDCHFLFNRVDYGGVGVSSMGNTIVRDCTFIGNSQVTDGSLSLLSAASGVNTAGHASGMNRIFEDCVITRNLAVASNPGTMVANGAGAFRRLVITNNCAIAKSANSPLLISLQNARYTGPGLMEDCLVADNIVAFRPGSGSVGVLASGHSTDRNASPLIRNTIFRENTFVAPSNDVTTANSCAVGIVGNISFEKYAMWMALEGCAFVSNRVAVANLTDGASAILSRGLLSFADAASAMEYGLANCTFLGPQGDGVADIAQYGVHSQPLNIVNCLFATDDPNGVAAPFVSETPSSLRVYDCAVQNWFPALQPTGYGVLSGVKPDPVPLSFVPTGVGDAAMPRPAVWTPGLRETCDIATNAPPAKTENNQDRPTYAFRTRDAGSVWQKLVPQAGGTLPTDAEPVPDALGIPRTFGATTAGSVQTMTPTAETGSSLTLRRDPFTAGTLSVPFNQTAATGADYVPVTATANAGGSFLGWLDEAGNPFSAANPLELVAPTTNLTLTASFGTASVTLTFSLDNLGAFDATGLSTTSLVCSAGAAFPEIPAFTASDGYVFVTWGDLPATVPDSDTTYTARIVTKELRRIYAAPDGTGDGTSWANAASFADAYADAATYRGEVWLKEGTYAIPAEMALRSNVAVLGGFAGSETSAAQADPAAHPTTLNGNSSGGLYWKPNGVDPGAGNRVAVWENGVLNPPNPGWADSYWQPASPAPANDAKYAFADKPGSTATNAAFRGLTFTGFSHCAIYSIFGEADGLTIENCRFVANGTAANTAYSVVHVENSPFALRACAFVGNFRTVQQLFSARPFTNEVADCEFVDNVGGGIATTVATNGSFTVDRCLFARNYSAGTAPVLALSSTWHFGLARFADCAIVSNRIAKGASALFSFNCANKTTGGGEYFGVPCLEIARCDLTDNIASGTRGLCFYFTGRYASIIVRDCHVARNVHTGITGQADNSSGLLYYDGGYGLLTFVNCLVERNAVTATSHSAGIVLINNAYSRSGIIGCTFADNTVTAPDPANAADFRIVNDNATGAHSLVNTVFDETAGGQRAVLASAATSPVRLWRTFARGQELADMGAASFSTDGLSAADPRVLPLTRLGPNGRPGRPVSSASPARTAIPVMVANDGNYYFYRPWVTGNNAKPWIPPDGAELTVSAAAAKGLSLDGPFVPDAWGQPRRFEKISCGHVNAARATTMFFVK